MTKCRGFPVICLMLMIAMTTAVPAEEAVLDSLMEEIEAAGKAVSMSELSFDVSADRQSIFIDRPEITGAANYTIAYNIYDNRSNPVNYFYSDEARVAATPGYGGWFNVFVVVTDADAGMTAMDDLLTSYYRETERTTDMIYLGTNFHAVVDPQYYLFRRHPAGPRALEQHLQRRRGALPARRGHAQNAARRPVRLRHQMDRLPGAVQRGAARYPGLYQYLL